MTTAEIIPIGTEILPSEIVDTNTRYLSCRLREQGIDLYSQTIVGANVDRLAQAIRHSVVCADIIITSGGLGPTVDDPTRRSYVLETGEIVLSGSAEDLHTGEMVQKAYLGIT